MTPPSPILEELGRRLVQEKDIQLCTVTDIDRLGRYKHQWLVVTEESLWVIQEGSPPELKLQMKISAATEFRIQGVVGSGLLQARVDGIFVDIMRFTNRLASVFHKVARKLDRKLQGQPIEIFPEDEEDERRCPTCGLMLQFAGDACPRCVSRGVVMARMWKLMAPYRKTALLMMGLLMIGIALDLVSPQLTRYLVDKVLPGSEEAAAALQSDPSKWRTSLRMLLHVVIILSGVQICRMVVNMANGVLGSRVGTAITYDIRRQLVEHLQKLSVSYYDRQQVGSLVARVAFDTEALHGFVMQLTGGFLFQLIMVIGVGVMVFTLNPTLALYTLIPAPLVMTGSVFFWRYIYPRYYRFWDSSSKQAGMLAGTLSGIRVVKAMSQEDREMERFTDASSYLRASRREVDMSTSVFNPVMSIVFQFGGWIVWYVGGYQVLEGKMTLGSLMAFFGYLVMFYGPLSNLTQFTNWLTQFVTQAHRIFEILDTPKEIMDEPNPVAMGEVKGEIVFDGVTFGYSRSSPVLQDVNFTITPGEMVGVVGRSGSGKTTLVNLMCRFYDVNEGMVRIDGKDVRRVAAQELRQNIGVVLQEPFLFRGSVYQNLTYGKPSADPEEVISAAKAGNAHDFILRQAHGYDTWVGERGAGLSGGERQRVGIARVLLTDPKILVLDEATSSVDAESEASIQAALKELVKGRTTIAIAHRLSTLRNANRILVVDQGKIIESGTHEELIRQDGLFARLMKLQGQSAPPTVDQLAEQEKLLKGEDIRLSDTGPLPDPRGHHPRWLSPGLAFIHLGNLGALHVTVPGEMMYGGVFAVRCMPVNFPSKYISLRYFDHEKREIEVGLMRDLEEWPEEAQNLIRDSLIMRYLIHTILSIESIRSWTGYLNLKVETDLGPMDFMMRWQHDRAHDYGLNGKMLLDTDDNRYLIPNVSELPPKEQALFRRYIYW